MRQLAHSVKAVLQGGVKPPRKATKLAQPQALSPARVTRPPRAIWLVSLATVAGLMLVACAGLGSLLWRILPSGPTERTKKEPAESTGKKTPGGSDTGVPIDLMAIKPARIFTGHGAPVVAVAFTENDQHILSIGSDMTLIEWNRTDGKEVRKLNLAKDLLLTEPVTRLMKAGFVAISRDGSIALMTISPPDKYKEPREIELEMERQRGCWAVDLKRAKRLARVPRSLCLSPAGDRVFSRDVWEGKISLWDTHKGTEIRWTEFRRDSGDIRKAAYGPDGRHVIGVYGKGEVLLWDTTTGEKRYPENMRGMDSIAFSLDSGQVIGVSSDNTVRVLAAALGTQEVYYKGDPEIVRGNIAYFDGQRVLSWKEPPGYGSALAPKLDDIKLRLWDAKDCRRLALFVGHTAWIATVTVSRDGRHILSGGHDRMVLLWNMPKL
jgi:WD40 repeat protein